MGKKEKAEILRAWGLNFQKTLYTKVESTKAQTVNEKGGRMKMVSSTVDRVCIGVCKQPGKDVYIRQLRKGSEIFKKRDLK